MAQFDGILIPGGGLKLDGGLPIWTQRRLDLALSYPRADYFIPLSAGSPHKSPPLDARGFPVLEAVAAGHYLIDQGVPPAQVLVEASSYDTIGNAYFARMIHTDVRQLRKLLVITSDFHLARTRAVFEWVFQLDIPEPAYDLTFVAAVNDGIAPEALTARQAKEAQGLAQVNALRSRLRTLAQLHHWLYTEHAAYALGKVPEVVQTKAIETY